MHEHPPGGPLTDPEARPAGAGHLLGAEGPFAALLPGFAPRTEQQTLADAIEACLHGRRTLVAEAGTGTGKTLSYLVPVIDSGLRSIVSTGTKNLQDQLFFKDLPVVRQALGGGVETALLKGRSNYLCLYRMDRSRESGELPTKAAVGELQAVHQWSASTPDGDLSLASVIADDSPLWPYVTSTPDNCLGAECPRLEQCHVALARRRAQSADVVVVNHHLLFADMAIKQSGFGEVLPGAEAFILDEAHQAPEIASRFFSASLTTRKVEDLCRDALLEAGKTSGGLAQLQKPVEACRQSLKQLQAAMADHLPERGSWQQLVERSELRGALQGLDQDIADLLPALEALEGSSQGLGACATRCREMQGMMDRLDQAASAGEVRWFERRGRGFGLNITPLDVAERFDGFRAELDAAWVFTSATLSVAGRFDHFTRQMGLDDADCLTLDSPFDYARNALLWLPEGLPEPRHPDFGTQMLMTVLPVLEASAGRAFMLFTSHRALQHAAEWLEERVDFPLFVQGQAPRSLLLERFRRSGDGILLGTSSFWSGVDVIGDALSLVIIDKLPFAAPDDPVIESRSEALRSEGGNPFMELYLPQAVIALKQGAGRLIRDVNDRGVLVICDSRLAGKSYGEAFLNSLPPMRRTDDLAEVLEFFADETVGD